MKRYYGLEDEQIARTRARAERLLLFGTPYRTRLVPPDYDHAREYARGMRWIYTLAVFGVCVSLASTAAVLWMLWELVQWVTQR